MRVLLIGIKKSLMCSQNNTKTRKFTMLETMQDNLSTINTALHSNRMQICWIVFVFLFFFIFFQPADAVEYDYDLGISGSDIYFSQDSLVSGSKVKIYASVYNYGKYDVSGYVTFYQGNILIGQSQVVSVKADGLADEVFVEFTVPSGSFNIRAEIGGTDPQDQNPANDIAITGMFYPSQDSDGDGIGDNDDNCVEVSNPSQDDLDGDGYGDACDPDIDNDGYTNDEEAVVGSNPEVADTDSDGLIDSVDNCPLVSNYDQKDSDVDGRGDVCDELEEGSGESLGEEETTDAISGQTEQGKEEKKIDGEGEEKRLNLDEYNQKFYNEFVEELGNLETTEHSRVFLDSSIGYEPIDWRTFKFYSLFTNEDDGIHYEWNFGDGVVSTMNPVVHSYKGPGSYIVSLKLTSDQGEVSQDKIEIHIGFFHPENYRLWLLIGVLLLLGFVFYYISSVENQERLSRFLQRVFKNMRQ